MSQDVSNRLLSLRNFYVELIRMEARRYGISPAVLAQQIYLALSATEAKPLVEDLDDSALRTKEKPSENPSGSAVRGDRPVVPPTGSADLTRHDPPGN